VPRVLKVGAGIGFADSIGIRHMDVDGPDREIKNCSGIECVVVRGRNDPSRVVDEGAAMSDLVTTERAGFFGSST
jgi:hypothetical protein